MGFNLAQICCNPPSSSSSTTQIFCDANFNKCSPCRLPCCCRNSVLNDHTYSILKRICHKIIKNYNRQQCREKYTVFEGGYSIGPRWSDRQDREGSEFSNANRQRGWENNKDSSRRDELLSRNKAYTGYTDGGGDLNVNRGKLKDNDYDVKSGSRKSRKGKGYADDGWDQLKRKGEGRDGKLIDDAQKADKGKQGKSKNRNARDSEETDEKDGKSKSRKDKRAAGVSEDRKSKGRKARESDDTAEKDGKSKGRKDKKQAGASDEQGGKERKSKGRKARDSDEIVEKDGKSKGRKDKKAGEASDERKSKGRKARDSDDTAGKDGKSKGHKDKKAAETPDEDGEKGPKSKNREEKERKSKGRKDQKAAGALDESGEKGRKSKNRDKKNAVSEETSTSKKGAGQLATAREKSTAETSKSKKGTAPNARGTDVGAAGEKGKQSKFGGGSDKKAENNRGTRDITGSRGTDKKAENNFKAKGDEKTDATNAMKKYRQPQKDSKGNIIVDSDKDADKFKKFRKYKNADERSSRLSESGYRRSNQFRDSSSRTRKDIKDSKFIQHGRPSERGVRLTRGDEIRTCDILRVHLEQRDLVRCSFRSPCRPCACNVCRICPPCPTFCC